MLPSAYLPLSIKEYFLQQTSSPSRLFHYGNMMVCSIKYTVKWYTVFYTSLCRKHFLVAESYMRENNPLSHKLVRCLHSLHAPPYSFYHCPPNITALPDMWKKLLLRSWVSSSHFYTYAMIFC